MSYNLGIWLFRKINGLVLQNRNYAAKLSQWPIVFNSKGGITDPLKRIPLDRSVYRGISTTSKRKCTSTFHHRRVKYPVPYQIRQLTSEDLPSLHALLSENNWNMDMPYLSSIFSTDPSGLIAVIGEDGNVIGHSGFMSHGPYLAAAGLNIMKEEYRELGIGRQLFHAVMEAWGDRNVGGIALSNRISFYRQFGWTIPSFTVHYSAGPIKHDVIDQLPGCSSEVDIVRTELVSFDDVVNYDAGIHTVPRKRFLQNWIIHDVSNSWTAFRNGKVVGYCVVRPSDEGWKIQPLFADSCQIASGLLKHCASVIPEGSNLILMEPIENEKAVDMARGNGLTPHLSMTRLYNRWHVNVDVSRVYSLSSSEIAMI